MQALLEHLMQKDITARPLWVNAERLTLRNTSVWREQHLDILPLIGVRVGDFIVNPDTGEVIGEYVVTPCIDVTIGKEERAYMNNITKYPTTVTHIDQLQDWLSVAIDGRKVKKVNETRIVHDQICGVAKRDNVPLMVSVPEYGKLDKLCKALTFRNFVIGDIEQVSKDVGVTKSKNLRRDFASLIDKGLVKIETSIDGMMKGQVKISVHPFFGYVHQRDRFTKSRIDCMADWTKQCVSMFTVEFITSLTTVEAYPHDMMFDDSIYESMNIVYDVDDGYENLSNYKEPTPK